MQATGTRASIKFGTGLTILFVMVGLGVLVSLNHADVSAATVVAPAVATSAHDTALLDGITLAKTLSDEDRLYLQANLQFLHDRLPGWWEYIAEAKPLALTLDEKLAGQGRAAIARCCEAGLYGVITFGHHFGQLTMSDDPAEQSLEAKQITFLGVLVHEVTHIRDQRAGRFLMKTDRKTCIAAESSGLTKQLEFKRDLASVGLGDNPAAREIYQHALERQIKVEAADLHDRKFWDFYCGSLYE